MDWKEKLYNKFQFGVNSSNWGREDAVKFIETEIIEKLIEEIPETIKLYAYDEDGRDGVRECATDYLKQQLKAKWLN